MANKRVLSVVGSREFPNLEMVRKWVEQNAHRFDFLVTGDARGVDKTAIDAWVAIKGPDKHKSYPADWDRYGAGAGMIRNVKIIRDAFFIAVFWDAESHGALDDIGLVLASGKPMNIYVRK